MDMLFLDRRACRLTHPRVSIGQFAEVWTTKLRPEEVSADKVVPTFLYCSQTDGHGQFTGAEPFAIEIEMYSLCKLRIVKTYVKHGQPVTEDGGTWDGLWLARIALQAWLNESYYVELIPNWVTMVCEWNMAHPQYSVLTEYAEDKVLNLTAYDSCRLHSCAFPRVKFL